MRTSRLELRAACPLVPVAQVPLSSPSTAVRCSGHGRRRPGARGAAWRRGTLVPCHRPAPGRLRRNPGRARSGASQPLCPVTTTTGSACRTVPRTAASTQGLVRPSRPARPAPHMRLTESARPLAPSDRACPFGARKAAPECRSPSVLRTASQAHSAPDPQLLEHGTGITHMQTRPRTVPRADGGRWPEADPAEPGDSQRSTRLSRILAEFSLVKRGRQRAASRGLRGAGVRPAGHRVPPLRPRSWAPRWLW